MSITVSKFGTVVYVSHDGILWCGDRVDLLTTVVINDMLLRINGLDIRRLNGKFLVRLKGKCVIGTLISSYVWSVGDITDAKILHKCDCALSTFIY